MPRNNPLSSDLAEAGTTTCRLLKITTANSPAQVFGLTTLDRAVTYDDNSGDGPIEYVGTRGFDPSVLRTDLGLAVDNAEARALISDEVDGITRAMIEAGELNDASWVCYLVNFQNLTAGRHVELGSGDVGDVRLVDGMLYIPELKDIIVRLQQPIGEVFSRRCRATFGLPATEENGQRGCGVDLAPLWTNGTVEAVGSEANSQFEASALASPHSFPGVVQFLTGDNAGREFSVESVDSMLVSLYELTPYPIHVGDTYRIRPDCGKQYLLHCIGDWSNGPNFKGEPYIPDGSEVVSVA